MREVRMVGIGRKRGVPDEPDTLRGFTIAAILEKSQRRRTMAQLPKGPDFAQALSQDGDLWSCWCHQRSESDMKRRTFRNLKSRAAAQNGALHHHHVYVVLLDAKAAKNS